MGPRRLLADDDTPERDSPEGAGPPHEAWQAPSTGHGLAPILDVPPGAEQVWQRVRRPGLRTVRGATSPGSNLSGHPPNGTPSQVGCAEAVDLPWESEDEATWQVDPHHPDDSDWAGTDSGRTSPAVARVVGRHPAVQEPGRQEPGGQEPGRLEAAATPSGRPGPGAGALLGRTKVFVVRHLGALGLVAVVALLFTGYQLMSASGGQAPLTADAARPEASTSGAAPAGGPSTSNTPSAKDSAAPDSPRSQAPQPAATPSQILVHVTGAVQRPGVVSLPTGARVNDALNAAGGLLPEAVLGQLNLAAVVVDGMQVRVSDKPGRSSELVGSGTVSQPGTAPGSTGGPAAPNGTAAPDGSGGQVNLNSATQQQLEALPGIGPVTATDIIAFRTEHGRFTKVEQLQEVSGIGAKTFEKIKPHVTV